MIQKKIKIINKLGLHARAAAKLVKTASSFSSQIEIGHLNKMVDAKNMIAVMLLALKENNFAQFSLSGTDEQEGWIEIEKLINNYFGEGE